MLKFSFLSQMTTKGKNVKVSAATVSLKSVTVSLSSLKFTSGYSNFIQCILYLIKKHVIYEETAFCLTPAELHVDAVF